MAHTLTAQLITSSVITLIICAFGLVGNLLCGVVLFNKHMTRTSYTYILQGLTISDTCLLTLSFIRTLDNLGLISLSKDVYFGTIIFFWDWISTSGTKYYTVTVSLERFFVITFPLKARVMLTAERAKAIACGVFGFCVLLSCFSFVYQNWLDPDRNSYDAYVAVVLHFVPCALVVIFNILVFIGLRRIQNLAIRKCSTVKKDDNYYVTRMLFAVMLVFGFCYSFEFIRRMMNYLWPEYMKSHDYYDYLINCLADIFYVLNSSVNFIIYCLLGKKFRSVFCEIFKIGKNAKSNNDSKEASSSSGGTNKNSNSDKVDVNSMSNYSLSSKQTDSVSMECDLNEI